MSRQPKTRQPVRLTIFLLDPKERGVQFIAKQNSYPSGCKRYWRLTYIIFDLIEGVLGLYLPAFIWASARGLAPSRQTYGDLYNVKINWIYHTNRQRKL